MKKIKLAADLEFSQIVHGHWRLAEWQLSSQELLTLTRRAIDLGITTFDHADIYGDYSCEKLFGEALALNKGLRSDIQLVTKCGIQLISSKFPERQVKHYDYSYDHIVSSVNNSLNNFGTDYVDLLLLHRPSPFFDPEEVARAFSDLKSAGKVLHFGVSNFLPGQQQLLQSCLDDKLVTNQIEISPYCLENFENGTLDYLVQEKIKPMAWSPLAGGQIMNPDSEKGHRLLNSLREVASELGTEDIDKVIYKWLLMHPAGIIPVVGTGKIARLEKAADAINLKMNLEQWFMIYAASTGVEVP
ncbi:MAG: aldo/keto reductase [Cyclobacteriaceae bacterium]